MRRHQLRRPLLAAARVVRLRAALHAVRRRPGLRAARWSTSGPTSSRRTMARHPGGRAWSTRPHQRGHGLQGEEHDLPGHDARVPAAGVDRAGCPRSRRPGVPVVDMDSDGKHRRADPHLDRGRHQRLRPDRGGGRQRHRRATVGASAGASPTPGGIDKRCIAKGGRRHRGRSCAAWRRVVRDGGYIPGCDHGVPHDISWPDFHPLHQLLAKLTGWL